jgi:hypothetical protein
MTDNRTEDYPDKSLAELKSELRSLNALAAQRNVIIGTLGEEAERLREELMLEQAARAQLHSQLPEEMQGCTIRFIECAAGHGRLTATNWLDHGCARCLELRLRDELTATQLNADLSNARIIELTGQLAAATRWPVRAQKIP